MRLSDFDFYEDIDDLPIWKKQEASNYALLANFCEPSIEGINSRMAQMDGHLARVHQFLEANDYEKAKEAVSEMYKARVNLSVTFSSNVSKTSYDTLIAACYVREIKGKKVSDKKDLNELKKISTLLESLSTKELLQKIESLKKKLTIN